MKKLIILPIILILITACQEKPADYQLRILIRNGTDSILSVILYPKSKYLRYGQYSYSDIHTRFKDTIIVPEVRLGTEIYITDDSGIEPQLLASRVFDSINVSYVSGKTLRFSHQGVINYSRNLFTDKSAWIYERNRFEHIRMWRDSFLESDDYTFVLTSGN